MWEILSLLKTGSDTLLTETIQHIDYQPLDVLEALPSPRVLATHMPFSRISRDFLSRACKVIWVVRNPWDAAVSYFNFIKKLSVFDYAGDWHGFFELFLDGNGEHISCSDFWSPGTCVWCVCVWVGGGGAGG